VTKGQLQVRSNAPVNLSKVRNKNVVIFSLEPVKHLPFAEICIELYKKHREFIIGLYRLINTDFEKTLFPDC
jgi:hypothetical protein